MLDPEEAERNVREHRRAASESIGVINLYNNQEAPRFASMEIKRKPLPRSAAFIGTPVKAVQSSDKGSQIDLIKASCGEREFGEPQQNPFDSEHQFEADMEGRILDAIPEATSTPRLGRSRLVHFSLPDQEALLSGDGFEKGMISKISHR